MSIKSLFDKIKIEKSLVNKTAEDIGAEVESVNYHEADILDESRFIPAVDFSKAENFARYGSAKKYYEDAPKEVADHYTLRQQGLNPPDDDLLRTIVDIVTPD